MAVYFKNAQVEVRLPVGQGGYDSPVLRQVHIQPISAQSAYDQFNVQVDNSYLLMDEVDGAELYALHGLVTWDGQPYCIEADPKVWNLGLPADHIEVVLRQVRAQDSSGDSIAPR